MTPVDSQSRDVLSTPAPDSASSLSPQTWVEIDLQSLRRNFRRVAERLPASCPLILSVKKDAYGHGIFPVVKALETEPRYAAAGVATVDEALALRSAGIESPLMIFAVVHGDALAAAIRNRIILTVTDYDEAAEASRAAEAEGVTVSVHYKIDTGMGRIGRLPGETLATIPELLRLPNLKLEGIYTHLPDGWKRPDFARQQMSALERFAADANLSDRLLHVGGSDGISIADHPALGALRTGIAVYGYHEGIPDLEPAMHFKTRVIYRRSAPAGSRISYNGMYTLQRDSELAVVGAGYGNGYPIVLSNKAHVLIRGKRCPVFGRVCMDQTIVDVTDIPEVQWGEEVVLFGLQQGEKVGADELARLSGSIPYEFVCWAGRINPRIYQPANASPESSAENPSRKVGYSKA